LREAHAKIRELERALGRIARRTACYGVRARPGGRCHRADDETVLQQIRAVTNSRATYGYRRVWAMVNRTFRARYNRKRIRQVLQLHGLMLAPRVHRRHGRPHVDEGR
jgi:putative transposase